MRLSESICNCNVPRQGRSTSLWPVVSKSYYYYYYYYYLLVTLLVQSHGTLVSRLLICHVTNSASQYLRHRKLPAHSSTRRDGSRRPRRIYTAAIIPVQRLVAESLLILRGAVRRAWPCQSAAHWPPDPTLLVTEPCPFSTVITYSLPCAIVRGPQHGRQSWGREARASQYLDMPCSAAKPISRLNVPSQFFL